MFVNLIRRAVPRGLRNAIRKPTTSLRRVKAKARHLFGDSDIAEPRAGWHVRCHPLCPEQFAVFRTDPEQAMELEDFVSHCRGGMKFLDVGAHWGLFTLAAIKFGGKEARVLAIEASSSAVNVCRRNIALNEGSKSATVIVAAAGAQAGHLEMLTTGAGGADYFVVPSEPRPDTIKVAQIAVDQVCRDQVFGPTHMKIDVEGWENEVLKGAEQTIRKFKPIIHMELHGSIMRTRGHDPRAVLVKLGEFGYVRFIQGDSELSTGEIERRGFNVRFVCLPARDDTLHEHSSSHALLSERRGH
jgi:FkbM family methyltransferase